MIIYTDIVTGDEIVSDTFRMKEIDGVVYEIDGKMVNKVIGGEVIDIGANPSETEGGDDMDTKTEQVIDICDAFRLEVTDPKHIDKKVYLSQLKSYMKGVKEALKKRGADDATVKDFQEKAQKYSAKILSRWDNYDTYTGQSQDPDGMYVLVDFREDGVTPYLTVWKHGLVETKV